MGAGIPLPRKTLWILLVSGALPPGPKAAEIYRWVDEAGDVHFGDRPQTPSAQKVEVRQGGADDTAAREVRRLERTQRLLDEYAMEREERELTRAEAENEKVRRREQCDAASREQVELEYSAYLYTRDKDGNKIILPDSELEQRRKDVAARVAEFCKPD
ncbi:MAG: DUF4124 domain-containing protein [Gammaproteobacteria bacterium]|nr:DUF4124 domain-containing protein [Gammaproteobacteria bacterium]